MAKHIEEVKKKFPEHSESKAFTNWQEWYRPVVDYTSECRERLSPENYKRYNELMGRVMAEKFSPETFAEVKSECLQLLEPHEDLKAWFEKTIGNEANLAKMHDHLKEKEDKSTPTQGTSSTVGA